ncbi:hypothetical protein HS7_07810 [Sulfolobales archaeon HS-7]|nr:hypothetical protein HS7_07810 [Sulfolobales archaeon HS-7]
MIPILIIELNFQYYDFYIIVFIIEMIIQTYIKYTLR